MIQLIKIEAKFTAIRHYHQCESINEKLMGCESIDRYFVGYLPSSSCDIVLSTPATYVYNVTYNGEKIETFVEFPDRVLQNLSSEYWAKNFMFELRSGLPPFTQSSPFRV